MQEGKLIIFAAPSGSGKTTIVKELLKYNSNFGFSISACTRDKRGRNEQNGKDYYFLTPEEFKKHIDNDDLVEWEEVYQGAFYGTLKSEINRIWAEGKHVLFDVDVKGAMHIKEYYKEKALSIFVKIPTMEILEERLRMRKTDSEESISRRLFKAKFEMAFQDKFDLIIVNDNLQKAVTEAQTAIDKFLKI